MIVEKLFSWLRLVSIILLTFFVALPICLYVTLSTNWARDRVRRVAEVELSTLLSTEVSIDRVEIKPFNRVSVYGISACDDNGSEALSISEVSAAFELFHFVSTGRMVFDFALVDGLSLRLSRSTKGAPLNISRIIDRLKSDKGGRSATSFDLKINTVVVYDGRLDYDIDDMPRRDSVFDPSHISLSRLNLNAYIPRLASDEYRIELDRFSFVEQSGFVLKNLVAKADISKTAFAVDQLDLSLPVSRLSFEPFRLEYNGFGNILNSLRDNSVNIALKDDSHIFLPDFAAFLPQLGGFDHDLNLSLDAALSFSRINLSDFHLVNDLLDIDINGEAVLKPSADDEQPAFKLERCDISADIPAMLEALRIVSPGVATKHLDAVTVRRLSARVEGAGDFKTGRLFADMYAGDNTLSCEATYQTADTFKTAKVKASADFLFSDIASLTGNGDLTAASGIAKAGLTLKRNGVSGDVTLDEASVTYKDYCYDNISANVGFGNREAVFSGAVASEALALDFDGEFKDNKPVKEFTGNVNITKADFNALNLTDKYEGYSLSAGLATDVTFSSVDDLDGLVRVSGLKYSGTDGKDLSLDNFKIEIEREGPQPTIEVISDFLNGRINGDIKFSTFPKAVTNIVAEVFPALLEEKEIKKLNDLDLTGNRFDFDFTLGACEQISQFFKLPADVIYPVTIDGYFDGDGRRTQLGIDAPYLRQGDKIIENTNVFVNLNAGNNQADVYATTQMPTKKGKLALVAALSGTHNRVDSRIDWAIERAIPLNGHIDFSTLFDRSDDKGLGIESDFNPGTITFGEELWNIKNSRICYRDKRIEVDRFGLDTSNQKLMVDGVISSDPADSLTVRLDSVRLIEIFETLEIDKALIGGTATGTIKGKNLLSSVPELSSDDLHVDDISYNYCVLGNADIIARWDVDRKAVCLDADIVEEGGRHSRIVGDIFPTTESLDITFNADHVKVGFMKPFMSAFASDLSGYASGRARLFGTFKYIDLEGDVFAEDLKIKIDFTNTWYRANDSIRLRPGLIDIKDVTIYDINGNTATLNGFVRHKFFKEPSFDFKVTGARNFLSYNVDSKISPDWYGTVYGNGGATISGEPGVVNIGVDMATAANSTFTFVLSDRLDADEYSFLTFRDRTPVADKNAADADLPEAVKEYRRRSVESHNDTPSAYNMDLKVDITPQARITLVMDPVGGDEIKTNGSGNLRLTYGSVNNELKMYGTYELEHGSYNFTLQDIIIKDFTIKEGSRIEFHGDPYAAALDIKAVYSTNANLSDLDESFLLDKDLNRTNVPVHALLLVTGDMRQPDIDFDLEFPTLTADTYRKVRSIVSTKEMMNRQIIYLLALNRFYTPDYMASTTKGNELFSVASSTISSQLSSILGKLSDNWSIAPNLRSDRGDFSDIEVDVALSSRLLNNRLLLNGNFGYRDKSLNTNQFIGDFDVEYLLNKRGSWRLKAYNRYNDQNFYVRTAQTTQGVGIMFKRDFDELFNFLKPRHKHKTNKTAADSDSIRGKSVVQPDSVAPLVTVQPE